MSQQISLTIKGDRHTASLSSHSHGVPFLFQREIKAADYPGVYTIALCPESYRPKVAAWYTDPANDQLIEGFGYPLGTLLLYSTIDAPFENLTRDDQLHYPANGTSLQGTIDCPYSTLLSLFGPPSPGDQYKVDAEWILRFPDGTIATIYNWKDGPSYCGPSGLPVDQITDWHIGGHSPRAVSLVSTLLNLPASPFTF